MFTRLLLVSMEGTEITSHGAQDGLKSHNFMHWLLISTQGRKRGTGLFLVEDIICNSIRNIMSTILLNNW
jgi:hypothetical protein